ncbi:MAG TPA: hypothetical protein VHW00_10875 [Thermoanaerobaculia bacterium]|nr:hypothetical protein [Thermoanaerobaculia bacterium]
MNRILRPILVCFFALTAFSQYTVTRYAGDEADRGYTDGTGAAARFLQITGIAVAPSGVVYVADYQNTIRLVSPDGIVSTIAGVAGISGNVDGRGVDARFNVPLGLAFDRSGNLLIADLGNNAIRRMTPRGDVSTIATVKRPYELAVDDSGTIFVTCADYAIRKVTPEGEVSVVAGVPGSSGNVNAVPARFGGLSGIAIDSNGDLLIMDIGNRRLRRVTRGGEVTTLAVPLSEYGGESLARDRDGKVWITAGSWILRVNLTTAAIEAWGVSRAVEQTTVDGPLASARFALIGPIAAGPDGTIYVGDAAALRRIDNAGVTTIAGRGLTPLHEQNGPLAEAGLGLMRALTRANDGTIYFAKATRIRRISPDGMVSDFAASPDFFQIDGLAVDRTGNLYAVDSYRSAIFKITPDGTVLPFAGKLDRCGNVNGPGADAEFCRPLGLVADSSGNVFVADYNTNSIRKITPDGVVSTFAGKISGDADGVGEDAQFLWPADLAIDEHDNLYVAEWGRPRIRKITPAGVVTTVAGGTTRGFADGGPGIGQFNALGEIEVDPTGIYVIDSTNLLRKVTFDGEITTLAGVPTATAESEGTGSIARFREAYGLATNGLGGMYVADAQARTIWYARPPGIEDRATISSPRASRNATLQLGTDVQTATTFTWSILRRAPGSSASLSATNIRTPQFTPDVPGRYTFLLRAENAAGGLRFSTVDLDVAELAVTKRRAVR